MDLIEVSKAEEWFNNSKHGKGRIAGFVPILMAEYAEHYHKSKQRELLIAYAKIENGNDRLYQTDIDTIEELLKGN